MQLSQADNVDNKYKLLLSEIEKRGAKVNRLYIEAIKETGYLYINSLLNDVTRYWRDDYRAALTSFACEAVGGDPDATIGASLALSLAGSGIGIHDDIIDRSEIKGFRKRIPGIHGPDLALVTGDVLVIKGLTAFRSLLKNGFDQNAFYQVLEIYEKFFLEMCEGEVQEIRFRKNLEITLDEYLEAMWRLGVDAEACTRIGAVIGGGDESKVESLASYGKRVGFLTRVIDEYKDILNVEGNLSHRIQYESIPLPLLYASKHSKKYHDQVKKILSVGSITVSDVEKILEMCYQSGGLDYLKGLAEKTCVEAQGKLDACTDSRVLKLLKLLPEKLLDELKI